MKRRSLRGAPPLPPGFWWWNTSALGKKPLWEMRPYPRFSTSTYETPMTPAQVDFHNQDYRNQLADGLEELASGANASILRLAARALRVPVKSEYVPSSAEAEDARRFRWLKQHVVFLHMGYGERDPVDGARPEWNINGDWTEKPNDRWYPSLEQAVDAESGAAPQTQEQK